MQIEKKNEQNLTNITKKLARNRIGRQTTMGSLRLPLSVALRLCKHYQANPS